MRLMVLKLARSGDEVLALHEKLSSGKRYSRNKLDPPRILKRSSSAESVDAGSRGSQCICWYLYRARHVMDICEGKF